MTLDNGDKAECKEIARVIVKEVLKEHIVACPFGKRQLRDRAMLVGACLGSGLGGGGLLFALLEHLTKGV